MRRPSSGSINGRFWILLGLAGVVALVLILSQSSFLEQCDTKNKQQQQECVPSKSSCSPCPTCTTQSCPPCHPGATSDPLNSCPIQGVNFEPPQRDAITGPRQEPLIPRKKSLVTIPVGIKGKDAVDKIIRKLGFDKYTFMLFHYDKSDWNDMEWADKTIRIQYPHQMKWWYLKRFVTPQAMDNFEYLISLDDDVALDEIDMDKFMNIFRNNNVSLGQPAQTGTGFAYWYNQVQQKHAPETHRVGRWVDFVECGPFTVISRMMWQQCIWEMVQEDLTSGIGLDLVWGGHCNKKGFDRYAVIDKYPVIHLDLKTARVKDGTGPRYNPDPEMWAYLNRYKDIKVNLDRDGFKTLGYIVDDQN